jgi:D-sedoheptulose 7-phosphate isomerase
MLLKCQWMDSKGRNMKAEESTASRLRELVDRYPVLAPLEADIGRACGLLIDAYEGGKKLLVCGNGGSAADAEHIVGELMKSFVRPRPIASRLRESLAALDPELGPRMASSLQGALPAIALTGQLSLSTAFANDVDPSLGFAQQVLGYGAPGDVFLGISTSGDARNVLQAAIVAKALGLRVIGLTGRGGGALATQAELLLAVPETETWKVQELHLPVYHAICLAVEAALFP